MYKDWESGKLKSLACIFYFVESVPMVLELIDEVLALHPGLKWFHIGGDEVLSLVIKTGLCSSSALVP